MNAMKIILMLGLVFLTCVVRANDNSLRVALLAQEDGLHQDIAFKYAVQHMNNDPRHMNILEMVIKGIQPFDSFSTGMITCDLTAAGIAGIFGPHSTESTGIVRSVCETLEIPHVITTWEPDALPSQYTNNVHPSPEKLSEALADIVKNMNWRAYTILYEEDTALIRLQGILQNREIDDLPVVLRKLPPNDYRPVLKELKKAGDTKIILDCDTDIILDVLRAAVMVNLMDEYCSYFLTSIDAHTVDFSEFKGSRANITTMRIINPASPMVQHVVKDIVDAEERLGNTIDLKPETLTMETALMYDAVLLYTEAVVLLNTSDHILQEPLECKEPSRWRKGLDISNFMRLRQVEGMTGLIEIDTNGHRTHFSLDIMELSENNTFRKIADWNTVDRFKTTRTVEDLASEISATMVKKLMRVTSRIGAPYLTLRNETDPPSTNPNDRFEGYAIDLIDEISRILNFSYEFKLVPDGNYGKENEKTREWDGMIGQLLKRKADLAICDLTITYEREKVVDFTMPFMNLGISILYRKSEKGETNLFSFLEPFSFATWIYLVTATMALSIILFITSRISPYDWEAPHPCNSEPEELENDFNMINCLWFSMGSILGAGCDILPKAVSTRMLAGWWWFFALIIVSSYTANLAAFLTVAKMETPLKGVEDLAKQSKVKYGTFQSGSTARFFEKSNISTYSRIWTVMSQAIPSVFTTGNIEGVDRVKKEKGKYAFFMESVTIEYQMERDCELVKIGGELDSKGYGIAMPPESPYRAKMNEAILRLQESGKLKMLKTRWWKEKGGGSCDSENTKEEDSDSSELKLANVGGVYLVLFFGCVLSFIVAVLEMLWNCMKIAVIEKCTVTEALKSELRFAMNFCQDTKPVRKSPDEHVEAEEQEEEGSFMHLRMQYDKA